MIILIELLDVIRYDTLARHILINKTYNDVIAILSPLKHIMM